MDYAAAYRRSVADRDVFWREQATRIDWHQPFDQVCDYSQAPLAQWFRGWPAHPCPHAGDRHVPARP